MCNKVRVNPSVLGATNIALPGGITLEFLGNVGDDVNAYSYGDKKGTDAVLVYNPQTGGLNGHAATFDDRSFTVENCGKDGHVWKEIDTTNLQEDESYDPEELFNVTL